jgi:rubrerythrin
MDRKKFEARLRQLIAADQNARDLYVDLCNKIDENEMKNQFAAMAEDEKRHVAQLKKIILHMAR